MTHINDKSDDDLINELLQSASIWFKDIDMLNLQELVKRYKQLKDKQS